MTTDELIQALRLCVNEGELKDPCKHCPANKEEAPTCMYTVMLEAADRLEELDERVSLIQTEDYPCRNCQEFVCDSCEYAKKGEETD